MKMILVPGYESLFGKPQITYEDLLKDVSSHVVISVMIMLNSELHAPIEERTNQKRLISIISERFSPIQFQTLQAAYTNFNKRANNNYDGTVFGRQYLVLMILKELNRNLQLQSIDTTPQQEYNIFIAYLLVIRHNNIVCLTEFKSNTLSDDVFENPDFDRFKSVVDERFIENKDKTPKGVSQLTNQIKLLISRKFLFDEAFEREVKDRVVLVYPILCFDEFIFQYQD